MGDQRSDEELIARARNGDRSAFKRLVERYEGKVAGIIKPMLGDVPQAVDVGQRYLYASMNHLENSKGSHLWNLLSQDCHQSFFK